MFALASLSAVFRQSSARFDLEGELIALDLNIRRGVISLKSGRVWIGVVLREQQMVPIFQRNYDNKFNKEKIKLIITFLSSRRDIVLSQYDST